MSAASSKKAPEPKNGQTRPWSGLAAVVIVLAAMLAVPFVLWAIVWAIAAAMGSDANVLEQGLSSPGGLLISTAVTEVATLGFLVWFIRYRGVDMRQTFALRVLRLSDVGWALLGIGVYMVLAVVSYMLLISPLGLDNGAEQDLGFDAITRDNLVYAFLALAVIPPIAEELIFRGFLYGSFRRRMSVWPAIIVSSLFFGGLHLFGSTDATLLWAAAIDVAALALVLGWLREKTGAIWASMLVHALKNSLAIIALLVSKGS